MFFKKKGNYNRKAVANGHFATFVFWGLVLFIKGVCELYDKEFIHNSLTILLVGIAIFFITEFISNKKSQANK
ncbi:hypothetical protein ACN6MY_10920 [Peribacillus sp. B-H-3]|uniref:hypothetical protein n=1 Tax=Peribacillus sp. B-H-3 TaxID=3400420 RepID=UPI003B021C8E